MRLKVLSTVDEEHEGTSALSICLPLEKSVKDLPTTVPETSAKVSILRRSIVTSRSTSYIRYLSIGLP